MAMRKQPAVRFIADVHVGNHRAHGGDEVAGINARCVKVLTALRDAAAMCAPDDVLVILGDLFDSPRPSPQVIARTMAALPRANRVIALLGNHDRRSDAPGDHALAPLALLPNVEVVEQPTALEAWVGGPWLACVPYLPSQDADGIAAAAKALRPDLPAHAPVALCLHAGLWDDAMPKWAKAARNAISHGAADAAARAIGARLTVSGDWHDHRVYEHCDAAGVATTVVQCGALCPTGWDNPGLNGYGSVLSWYGNGAEVYRHEVSGPRFIKADAAALSKLPADADLYVRATALDGEEAARAAANPRGFTALEVRRVDLDPKAAAARAAKAARSTDTLDAALAAYCAELELPDGLDGDRVADCARGYIARAEE